MAATAVSLHLRPKRTQIANPTFLHFHFSSSSTPSDSPDHNDQNTPPPPPPQQSPFSSYFSDVKANLKRTSPPPPSGPSHSLRGPKTQSFDEIRKSLSQFSRPSNVPPPHDNNSSPAKSPPISFQDLYRRRSESSTIHATNKDGRSAPSYDAIRESLRQLKTKNDTTNQNRDPMSLRKYTSDLKLRPGGPSTVFGGTDEKLPVSVFRPEAVEEKKEERESPAMRTEFVRSYSFVELGEKLRKLRPEEKRGAGDGFSLGELNERLVKLREAEKKETEKMIGGIPFNDLRQSLMAITVSGEEKNKKQIIQRLDVLGQLGETPNFMLSPPKDHLVEKYFHPDNMSSSEKMKLELQKVRDEFKMSESDCGSARVQVAQLTTKIKHLSTALDKKDKHSRKGLQAMVQRRKKLLKYLRRTDWDSYCMVLSRLGLRDNPDFKILTYPQKTA